MRNKHQKGFTLIELLVVIVILGILSTISVGTFRSYFAKARDAERVSAIGSVATMIQTESAGNGDASVYNYAATDLEALFAKNDFSLPEVKSGMKYYYGVHVGTIAGDNEFFVLVCAEDESSQGVVTITTPGPLCDYALVAGTPIGKEVAAECTFNSTTGDLDTTLQCTKTIDSVNYAFDVLAL